MIEASSSGTTALAAWGPILVASAGFITAIVAAFTRRDRRQADQLSGADAKINTALKGLEAALDRTERERARWQTRAETAEAACAEAKEREEACDEELASLRAENARLKERTTRTPRKPRGG